MYYGVKGKSSQYKKMSPVTFIQLYSVLDYYYSNINVKAGFYCYSSLYTFSSKNLNRESVRTGIDKQNLNP